jgi:H/ACA ribonucleoprotein complex subunit 4
VLPIAFEHATKAIQAFLLSGKEYVCLMQLHDSIAEERISEVFHEFTGKILQKPPLRSSVKRVVRERVIYAMDLLETEERSVLFKIACSQDLQRHRRSAGVRSSHEGVEKNQSWTFP